MSKVIFKEPRLQKAFETDGFVQIPLLEAGDLAELNEMHAHYFPQPAEGFFSSSYLNDYELKKEISDRVAAIIGRRLGTYFQNHRVFGSAFLSKTAGHRSQMPMHQDWTVVDESQFVAVNIWTPLQDVNRVNGALEVLKGSHNFAKVRRSPTIPFFWEGYTQEMQERMTLLEVNAGNAVVLNQALVHASPPNTTDEVRLAITTGLMSAGASMEFYYQTQAGDLDVYDMPDDFLLRFENFHEAIFARPTFGELRETTAYNHPKLPREAVLSYLHGLRPRELAVAAPESGLWSRLVNAIRGGRK